MEDAKIENSDLSYSIIANSSLSDAHIQSTNMENSDIDNTCLSYTKLTKVNLRESYLIDGTWRLAVLEEVLLDRASFEYVNIFGCIFVRCSLIGTDFGYSTLEDAEFIESDLRGAIFGEANLINTSFIDCIYNKYTVWPKNFDVTLHPKLIKKEINKSNIYTIKAATTGRMSCT